MTTVLSCNRICLPLQYRSGSGGSWMVCLKRPLTGTKLSIVET